MSKKQGETGRKKMEEKESRVRDQGKGKLGKKKRENLNVKLTCSWWRYFIRPVVLRCWVATQKWVADPSSVGRGPLPGEGNAKKYQKN